MANTFVEVKQPLKKEDLIPFTETAIETFKHLKPIPYTYNEIKEFFEQNGFSINNLFIAKEGLYPFWYVEDFVFAPIANLIPSIFDLQLKRPNVDRIKNELKRLWNNQEYMSFFSQVESQFGFDIFFRHIDEISEEYRYPVFKKLYTRNEYGFQGIDYDLIRELFALNSDTTFKKHLPIDPDGYVTIYRGMQEDSASPEEAYSWTLDFEVAKYFATRFNSTESSIYQARVSPDNIIDYITEGHIGDRGEEEIFVLPENLLDLKNLGFYNLNDEMFQELQKAGIIEMYQENAHQRLKGKWFHKPDGIHGKRHIKRVLLLSLIMSYLDDLSEQDRQILIYASLYHDIGREHDWEDEEHG